jgi:hypothetical protein
VGRAAGLVASRGMVEAVTAAVAMAIGVERMRDRQGSASAPRRPQNIRSPRA